MADNKGQIIITIGREYGSLGHLIADKAGKKLGLPVLDKALLHKMAENHGFDPRFIKDYDEKKRNPFTSRSINGHTNSIEDVLAEMVFKYERDLADTGESFIIVGRCAEEVLKDRPGLIRVFITGDYDTKLTHLVKDRGFTEREAADLMKKMDNKRRSYHNYHSSTKWGEASGYDLVINSSALGIDNSAELICKYVELWKNKDILEERD